MTMRKFVGDPSVSLVAYCAVVLLVASPASAQDTAWERIFGNEQTVCSDGSSYDFFVRRGDPERVLVHFSGGGACSNAVTCDPDLEPTPYIRNMAQYEPVASAGVFDFANAENPFRDYSVVYAPYCSGDVHLGDTARVYQAPAIEDHAAHPVEIQHRGMVNADFVLDWLSTNLSNASQLFVSGSSAGAIPSPFFAMRVAEAYPDARVAHLADSAAGYLPAVTTTDAAPDDTWGSFARLRERPEFADLSPADNSIVRLFEGAADSAPEIVYAAFDFSEDQVQKTFSGLLLGGDEGASLLPAIDANQGEIRSALERFRSYIARGAAHTILLRPEFYTLDVNGMRFRDWVDALARFESVADVRCDPCVPVAVTRP